MAMETESEALMDVAVAFAQRPSTLALVATVLVLVLAARLLPASSSTKDADRQRQAPPEVPFWLPFVGHAPQMLVNTDGFLARLRDRYYPDGVFSLRLFGRLHHFVYRPGLANAMLNRPRSAAEGLTGNLLRSVFGFSAEDEGRYAAVADEARAQLKHLLSEPGLGELVDGTVGHVRRHIADLVTFNSYLSDQMDWERRAEAEVVEGAAGESYVEADLMELTRNFVAKTANCALYGTDFVENFPDIWQQMWTFDRAFVLLGARVPGWLPIPTVLRGKRARSQMLAAAYEFNVAFEKHVAGEEPGVRWQDLDNVSRVVKARYETYRKHGLSLDARAGCDVAFLWGMNANANQLVPWMLFELYRDPVLLADVRREIAPHVVVSQPENDFGPAVWLPPTLDEVDVDGLLGRCPLLKAAYIETLRLYTGPWTMRWLAEDVVLDDKSKKEAPYLLRKGTYAHVPQELHQYDPEYFPDPHEWHHERHLKEVVDDEGNKTVVADMATMRPYGGGPSMCKGRAFALRELLLYSAVIISFYDMQPPSGQGWEVPRTYRHAATRHPKKPIRVWIKRRPQRSRAEQGRC